MKVNLAGANPGSTAFNNLKCADVECNPIGPFGQLLQWVGLSVLVLLYSGLSVMASGVL
jgi:hypothetical protein